MHTINACHLNLKNRYFSFECLFYVTYKYTFNNSEWRTDNNILIQNIKTLNVINQTLPIIKQASPIIRNTKTMFKVMNEFKKVDAPPTKNQQKEDIPVDIEKQTPSSSVDQGPTFFM